MKTIYEYQDYKVYLRNAIKSMPNAGHGFKGKLAKAANCQRAFVSQVLSGDLHFNLEQAYGVTELLEHSDEERDFFLLMLQKSRAGTTKLQKHFMQKMESVRTLRRKFQSRLKIKDRISEQHESRYYSAWYYSAVHILVTIHKYQTRGAIAERLLLPMAKVTSILAFLEECGLVIAKGNRYHPGLKNVLLTGDSPNFSKNHHNWRMRAIHSMDDFDQKNYHLSSVMSVSKKDIKKLQKMLTDFMTEVHEVIHASKEEELCALTVDFFEV